MANSYTLCGLFKAIANVIREKTGTTDSIPAKEFPDRIFAMGRDLFVEIVTGEVTNIDVSDINGITSIGQRAFTGCVNLESISLPSTITSINSYAFTDCTNLKTINVAWAEGDIVNAPWGATNATITYNYGG